MNDNKGALIFIYDCYLWPWIWYPYLSLTTRSISPTPFLFWMLFLMLSVNVSSSKYSQSSSGSLSSKVVSHSLGFVVFSVLADLSVWQFLIKHLLHQWCDCFLCVLNFVSKCFNSPFGWRCEVFVALMCNALNEEITHECLFWWMGTMFDPFENNLRCLRTLNVVVKVIFSAISLIYISMNPSCNNTIYKLSLKQWSKNIQTSNTYLYFPDIYIHVHVYNYMQ